MGGKLRLQYKIIETKKGFSVWKLTDYGMGYAFDDTGRCFQTEESARKYIKHEKECKKMTPTEKAKETRKRHLEARKAKDLESKELREKLKTSCLSILEDPRLTPGERLEALKILHDLEKGR